MFTSGKRQASRGFFIREMRPSQAPTLPPSPIYYATSQALSFKSSDTLPAMDRCEYCKSIPSSFFDAQDDGTSRQSLVLHSSYKSLAESAEAGCPFCQLIFACSESKLAAFSFEQQQKLKRKPVSLCQSGGEMKSMDITIYLITITIASRAWYKKSQYIEFELACIEAPRNGIIMATSDESTAKSQYSQQPSHRPYN